MLSAVIYSALGYPAFTVGTITGTPEVRPSRPLVLGKGPLNALTPTPDMDRTISRRSEPSSRTALMGE
ncbi:hypothetical protein DEO72_LG3g1104 [Vigna unguiculata]|uniref:Uncharacterized protein n=1 Tax=Vigna unguiculata TaxID=3917 RepID=A0A4D6LDK8_VIGUN|nr:hypothetical protein DEO72_LG3g1104 [Vigna unguiculata]